MSALDMYGTYARSTVQKAIIALAELALLALAYAILFGGALKGLRDFGVVPSQARNATLLAFDLVVAVRMTFGMFVFQRRRIPWDEAGGVMTGFALYLVGFPLMARPASVPFGALGIAGVVLFVVGSFLNTFGEVQRHRFKARPENRGKLYTGGLFSASMHINYFGDVVWVTGYACVTHNPWAFLVPAFLFAMFYFANIPKLDAHLREHYGEAFVEYERRTKKIIPFLL